MLLVTAVRTRAPVGHGNRNCERSGGPLFGPCERFTSLGDGSARGLGARPVGRGYADSTA
jgi:hypothetical protein